jgi:hypothetical protein
MNDEPKKLEAIGDALVLAVARLYLHTRHSDVDYKHYQRLLPRFVSNRALEALADHEGITGEQPADAFEREIARRFYREGFASVRAWLWSLFDAHVDVKEELRRLTDPTSADAIYRVVLGGLRNVLKGGTGKITEGNAHAAAQQIASRLVKRAE